MTNEQHSSDASAQPGTAEQSLRCDFCGEEVGSVRRIALDGEYERLVTRHSVQYACERCSEKKERDRTGDAG